MGPGLTAGAMMLATSGPAMAQEVEDGFDPFEFVGLEGIFDDFDPFAFAFGDDVAEDEQYEEEDVEEVDED